MTKSKFAIAAVALGICLLPMAQGIQAATRWDGDIRAVTGSQDEKLAKLKINKWCCHFTDILGHHRNVTISSGFAAVTACWSVAASLVPAIKHVQVTKGAC